MNVWIAVFLGMLLVLFAAVFYVLNKVANRLEWIHLELERMNNREAAKENLDG